MFNLYFGGAISVITTVLVAAMIVFIALALKKRGSIKKWGRLIGLFILVGTAISAVSATRDGYAAQNALFSMSSVQSNICSIAGGAIFLAGLISLFLRKQELKKRCFFIISVLFVVQVSVIEISRILLL